MKNFSIFWFLVDFINDFWLKKNINLGLSQIKPYIKNLFRTFIDVLPEFLLASLLEKKVTWYLITKKSNSDLNNDLGNKTKREELSFKKMVLEISIIELFIFHTKKKPWWSFNKLFGFKKKKHYIKSHIFIILTIYKQVQ